MKICSILGKTLSSLLKLLKFILLKLTRRFTIAYLCLFLLIIYWCYYYEILTRIVLINLNKELKQQLKRDMGNVNVNQDKVNFKFIHKASQNCVKRPPFLVLLIKSKVTHFEERNAVRNSWAQSDEYGLIRRVFLIGMPNPNDGLNTSEVTQQVEKENAMYGDIVQQNFYDAYHNNTLQTLMGFEWAFFYCFQAKFYLFIDDDNFMNPKLLIEQLKIEMTKPTYDTFYGGYVFYSQIPARHVDSRWYMPKDEYPYIRYPPYVSGSFFILAPKTLELFYLSSHRIRLFKFDDVYVGMLAYALDIKPVFIDRVFFYPISFDPNLYANKIISVHKISGSDLFDKWKQIENMVKFDVNSLKTVF